QRRAGGESHWDVSCPDRVVTIDREGRARVNTHKGEAGPGAIWLSRFENKGARPSGNKSRIHTHRGDPVREQPTGDRYNPVGLAQSHELAFRRPRLAPRKADLSRADARHESVPATSKLPPASKHECSPVWHAGPS